MNAVEQPDAAQRQAVVLSGGGANGAYALGVMEALFGGNWKRGRGGAVDASVFTGTSVGAYTAALMASLFELPCLDAVRLVRRVWLDEIAEMAGKENGVYRIRGDVRRLWDARGSRANRSNSLLRDTSEDLYSWTRDLLWRSLHLTFSEESPP